MHQMSFNTSDLVSCFECYQMHLDLTSLTICAELSLQELLNKAILASVAARRDWDLKPVADRAQILFKAADVISGPRRAEVLAKTMIGQVRRGPCLL